MDATASKQPAVAFLVPLFPSQTSPMNFDPIADRSDRGTLNPLINVAPT
ncbi:MAG TPA: hypothetical protein VGG11_14065 [Xanthobacteraceae bacterium]|jgi:hypothetical protein